MEIVEALIELFDHVDVLNQTVSGITIQSELFDSAMLLFKVAKNPLIPAGNGGTQFVASKWDIPVYFVGNQAENCRVYDNLDPLEVWLDYQFTGTLTPAKVSVGTASQIAHYLVAKGRSQFLQAPKDYGLMEKALQENGYWLEQSDFWEFLGHLNEQIIHSLIQKSEKGP